MPTSQYASPFEKLTLSDDEKTALRHTADELLADAKAKYERHIDGCEESYSDSPHWSLLRRTHDLRVHRDRRPGGDTENAKVHSFVTEGTVDGGLEDVMYALRNTTEQEMRIRTAYMDDTLVDGAILSSIQDATYANPFDTLSVRWRVKGVPLLMRLVTKLGDNVVLEATGMRWLANGQQIGFHVIQSVEFPTTPRLPNFQRYNLSSCSLWRQVGPERVEVFVTTFLKLADTVAMSLAVKVSCDVFMSMANVMECALLKKLTWLVQHRPASRPNVAESESCSVCHEPVRGASRKKCASCGKPTCKTCREKKKLCLPTPGELVVKQEMRFCLQCLATAKYLDAAQLAQRDAEQKAAEPRRVDGK